MARPKLQQWPRIRKRINPGGSTSYLVDLSTATTRERKFFKSKADAETFAAQKKVERDNLGTAAFAMPDSVKTEAATVWKRLTEVGVTLTQAADYYFLHARPEAGPIKLSALIKDWVARKEAAGKRPEYLRIAGYVLNRFGTTFGDRFIHQIGRPEIERWFTSAKHWSPRAPNGASLPSTRRDLEDRNELLSPSAWGPYQG